MAETSVEIIKLLRTVVFVDAVDSSSLMRTAEAETLATLQSDLCGLTLSIQKAGGEVNKSLGDGLIATFDSAVAACECACSFLKSTERGQLRYRIGIHVGEVSISKDDVFGDAVNIAARLEAAAKPGSIYGSIGFYDAIRSTHGSEWKHLGSLSLKGLESPMNVYGWGETGASRNKPEIKGRWWVAIPVVALLGGSTLLFSRPTASVADSKNEIERKLVSAIKNYQPEAQDSDAVIEEVYNQFWDEVSAFHEARDQAIRDFEPKFVLDWLGSNPLGKREKGIREIEHWSLVQIAIDKAKSQGATKPDQIRVAIKKMQAPELRLAAKAFEEEFGVRK